MTNADRIPSATEVDRAAHRVLLAAERRMSMERLTEKRNGTNVIPLRNAICGTDMPYWKITTAGDLTEYLSGNAADRLAAYEDTGLEPEEITAAIADAVKLILTMRNNKKAALWLKKYGPEKAGDTP